MTGGAPRVRTLIVDDEPLARRRLRTILATEPDVDIVGEASNGTAAVVEIAEKRPTCSCSTSRCRARTASRC
jgi:two-component system, LytTR family, response regulator